MLLFMGDSDITTVDSCICKTDFKSSIILVVAVAVSAIIAAIGRKVRIALMLPYWLRNAADFASERPLK